MALANRGQRSPRRSEQRSYLARLVCTFLEQLVATPDDLMNLRYALAAKRRLMPILTSIRSNFIPGKGLLTLIYLQVYDIIQREWRPVSVGWSKWIKFPCVGKVDTGLLRMAVDRQRGSFGNQKPRNALDPVVC